MPDPHAITLNHLIGPDRAGQFLNTRIQNLTTQDLLPRETAERMVCQAVAAGDPWTLAAGGQQWNLRLDADPELPPQLYVVRRAGGRFLAEDEDGQQETLGLSILESYQLTHWYGTR
ncbi:hypothetical protein [Streptomyces sp. ME19-01-6]|uniref:hypothetical protein n=1 Tax=Streptomyces sp. ME19-01-6 TaxID=3028686 RepID=UPI0029B3B3C2|nr:hypothetical protein [Streptomyces sp. ME19-01-6]MDX3232514.1 hypothetical protein [Streptomyces sp. ME19-01-6]